MKKIQSLISKWREAMLLLLLLISQIGQAQITPSDYEHTMSVTSQLYIDGNLNNQSGYIIQVYDGAELVGTSEYNVEINGGLYSFLTVYSNSFFETYTVRIISFDSIVIEIGEISFESNSILGSISNPVIYSIGSAIQGCIDAQACNFNVLATVDDGTCLYANLYFNCEGTCINDMDGDGECDESEVDGCMDSTASNYNPNSTNDDETCVSWEDAFYSLQLSHEVLVSGIEIREGWSMFGYTCALSDSVHIALTDYSDKIIIVKDDWGLSWIVDYGFNAIGSLQYGEGYQIKTTEAIENFQLCPSVE
tara:strand:- start:1616 stop:2536 length:921 start_codon:yes stop_codon:yes gene_type:complete